MIMRWYLPTLFLMLTTTPAVAQQVMFLGERVDSVIICCTTGYSKADTLQTFQGSTDRLSIVREQSGSFTCRHYDRHDFVLCCKDDTLSYVRKPVAMPAFSDVQALVALCDQLQQQSPATSLKVLGWTEQEFREKVSPKKIQQVAKKHGYAWHFDKAYSTDAQNAAIYQACANADTLHRYLIERIRSENTLAPDGYKEEFAVTVYTANAHVTASTEHPRYCRQPWVIAHSSNPGYTSHVVNLGMNPLMELLLPKGFLCATSFRTSHLVEDYVVWYFQRCGLRP